MFQLPWFAANSSMYRSRRLSVVLYCSNICSTNKLTPRIPKLRPYAGGLACYTPMFRCGSSYRRICILCFTLLPLFQLPSLLDDAEAFRRHFATTSVACRRCLIRLLPLIRCLHSPYIHGGNSTGTFSPKTWQPIQRATRTAYRVVLLRVSVVLVLISGETTLIGGSCNQSWHP